MEDAYLGLRSFKLRMTVNPMVLSDQELIQLQQIPTLYLVDDREAVYKSVAALERLNCVAPEIKTVLVPNAGHNLTIVQSGLINDQIASFIIGH